VYYAAFYAVSPLLLKEGIEVKTNGSQKSRYNQLPGEGKSKRECGNIYNVLFTNGKMEIIKNFSVYMKMMANL